MAEKKRVISLLPFVAALLAGLLLFTGTAAGVVVSMDPPVITLSPGGSGTVNLILDSAPAGLSGYAIGIRIVEPEIVDITTVTFPPWAGLSDSRGVPGSDVQILAVDLKGEVEKNAGQVILATLTLQGRGLGTSPVLLSQPVFHDDEGSSITPSLADISVTVTTGETAPSGGSAGGSGGGGAGYVPVVFISPDTNQSGAEVMVQVTAGGENQTPGEETPSMEQTATIPATTGEQAVPGTPVIPFLSLPLLLMALGTLAFLAAKKR